MTDKQIDVYLGIRDTFWRTARSVVKILSDYTDEYDDVNYFSMDEDGTVVLCWIGNDCVATFPITLLTWNKSQLISYCNEIY
jgi:hypothetical protein